MEALKLILRNVRRQPRRAVLTLLTFAVATFIFTVLAAIPSSIDMILKRTAENLRVYSYNANGRFLGLPARYCRTIEKIPGVVACAPMGYLRATYRNEREIIKSFALDPDNLAVMYPDYDLPPQALEEFSRNRIAAVAGKLLIRTHGWKTGDSIILRGDSNRLKIRFRLVGAIPSGNYPNFFVFRRDYLVEAEEAIGIPEEKHPPGLLATRIDSAADVPLVIHKIDETFHNSDFETATMTESEAIAGLMSTVGDIRGIVYTVFVVILLTVFLIAANSMSMMVRDRLSDVAVLRALGFGPGYVILLLLGECALIGSVGGISGTVLALWQFGGGMTLGGVMGDAGYLTITHGAAAAALAAAVLVSVLSGIVPVLGALRMTPADAFHRAI
ncbi:MAG: FtsX-like permease family protein [Candidatus Binataceae bacterium]